MLAINWMVKRTGSAYGDTTNRYIRLSFGTETDEDIKYALDCIKSLAVSQHDVLNLVDTEYEAWRSLS